MGGGAVGLNLLLSQTAEYALRVMTVLARQEPGESLLGADLSLETGIPREYLSKILRRLVLAGLLESRKGRGGGFALVSPAAKLTFKDVLTAVDAYPRDDRCAFGWGSCDKSKACPLHASWSRMNAYFLRWAEESTLAAGRGPIGRGLRPKTAVGRLGSPARSSRSAAPADRTRRRRNRRVDDRR
jgi:Rrf2 family protein